MIKLLRIVGLLISTSAFADPSGNTVTVRLSPNVDVVGTQTNVIFRCAMTINNQTGGVLIATNLFSMSPGLALEVTEPDGKWLKTLYAPWLTPDWILRPGRNRVRWLYYGMDDGLNEGSGNPHGVSRPDITKTLRLQIEGTLSGTGYTNHLISNMVQVHVPKQFRRRLTRN